MRSFAFVLLCLFYAFTGAGVRVAELDFVLGQLQGAYVLGEMLGWYAFRLSGDRYFVAFSKGAAFQHFAEEAFAGHYAVAHLVVDGAMRVAFFADLREFKQYVAGTQARAYGERFQIESFYDQVLAERPVFNVGSCGLEVFYAFVGKEADLPMPVSGVRIAFDSPIGA